MAGETPGSIITWSKTQRPCGRHTLDLAKGSSSDHHALGRPDLGRKVPAGQALPGRTSAHWQ